MVTTNPAMMPPKVLHRGIQQQVAVEAAPVQAEAPEVQFSGLRMPGRGMSLAAALVAGTISLGALTACDDNSNANGRYDYSDYGYAEADAEIQPVTVQIPADNGRPAMTVALDNTGIVLNVADGTAFGHITEDGIASIGDDKFASVTPDGKINMVMQGPSGEKQFHVATIDPTSGQVTDAASGKKLGNPFPVGTDISVQEAGAMAALTVVAAEMDAKRAEKEAAGTANIDRSAMGFDGNNGSGNVTNNNYYGDNHSGMDAFWTYMMVSSIMNSGYRSPYYASHTTVINNTTRVDADAYKTKNYAKMDAKKRDQAKMYNRDPQTGKFVKKADVKPAPSAAVTKVRTERAATRADSRPAASSRTGSNSTSTLSGKSGGGGGWGLSGGGSRSGSVGG